MPPTRIRTKKAAGSGGGGGGGGGPTVTYLDRVGAKDTQAWVISQSDAVGAQDQQKWVTTQPDAVGAKDNATITGLGTPQWRSVANTVNVATVTIPADVQVGDLMLLFVGVSAAVALGNAAVNVPAGWTAATGNVAFLGTVVAIDARVLWRVADGTEGGSVTISFAGGSRNQWEASVHRVTAFNTTTPINVTASATLAATALNPDPVSPTVTTTTVNCLIFRFLTHYHAALTNSHTAPAGHEERNDFESSLVTLQGHTVDTIVKAAAGATGTAVHDCSETVATDAVMITVAVAPGAINIVL